MKLNPNFLSNLRLDESGTPLIPRIAVVAVVYGMVPISLKAIAFGSFRTRHLYSDDALRLLASDLSVLNSIWFLSVIAAHLFRERLPQSLAERFWTNIPSVLVLGIFSRVLCNIGEVFLSNGSPVWLLLISIEIWFAFLIWKSPSVKAYYSPDCFKLLRDNV